MQDKSYLLKWNWTNEKLSLPDVRFLSERKRLESLGLNNVKILDDVIKNKKKEFDKTKNVLSLYSWGYSCYLLKRKRLTEKSDVSLYNLLRLLDKINSNGDIEFQKMRFLLFSRFGYGNSKVLRVGEVINKQDPSDIWVLYELSRKSQNGTREGMNKAIEYAKMIIKYAPGNTVGYHCMQDIYGSEALVADKIDEQILFLEKDLYWTNEWLKRETVPSNVDVLKKHIEKYSSILNKMKNKQNFGKALR